MKKKYKIISSETIKNLIEFLDEIQFDAATSSTVEDMHKVNFCNWAIQELLNSYDIMNLDESAEKNKSKKNKRDNIIDEHFVDWELPDMSDEEFEKLVSQFDNFLKSWEKEYNKKNSKKKSKKETKEWKPKFGDVVEHCSLEEIKDMLLDDPELTDEERFDLYYIEHERVKGGEKGFTLDEICKEVGINKYKEPPKK